MQYRIEFKTSFDRSFTHMVHSDDVQSAKLTASSLRHDDEHIFDVKLFKVGQEPHQIAFY